MSIGADLVGDLEQRMAAGVLRRRGLFRMTGPTSQSWRAEQDLQAMHPGGRVLLLPSATIGLALVISLNLAMLPCCTGLGLAVALFYLEVTWSARV